MIHYQLMYQGFAEATETAVRRLREIVFPQTDNAPTVPSELAGDKSVAGDIGGQFLGPECLACPERSRRACPSPPFVTLSLSKGLCRFRFLHRTPPQPPGRAGMNRTPVPETPVDENDYTLLGKSEIGSSDQFLMASPSHDVICPQQLRQRNLGVLVPPPANPRHHFRPLPLGEYVRHQTPPLRRMPAVLLFRHYDRSAYEGAGSTG